ncbi:MAG: hypothetical protein M3463_11905 [Verrucomicrobiota bacterium]|nr:hypothetical protein [Verrucomicrobiota bacterium]
MPLALLTTHFNPAGYRQNRRNLWRFLRQMEAEGVPVYVAELAIGEADWVLPESANILRLRARLEQVLWYKENLLNLVERIVPVEFDRLAWVDADVWFQRLDWFTATEEALGRHAVVQMCDRMVWTEEDGTVAWTRVSAARAGRLVTGRYHPGMAWAARRTLWAEGGGLYERAIVGGGDSVNAAAWLPNGGDLKWTRYSDLPGGIARLREWAAREGTCGFVEGTLWHEWHGDERNRRWGRRHSWLEGVDVQRDLRKREDGLLEWSEDAPREVQETIRKYFAERREDGKVPPSHRPVP